MRKTYICVQNKENCDTCTKVLFLEVPDIEEKPSQ